MKLVYLKGKRADYGFMAFGKVIFPETVKEHDKKVLVKNTFLQGAFISTLGIIISKVLGIIYVIPFYAIIGESSIALYGYAYTIYNLFIQCIFYG